MNEIKLPNITCSTFADWLDDHNKNKQSKQSKQSSNKLILIIDKDTNTIEKYNSIEQAYYFTTAKDSNTNF